jgi:hypothetical protein
LLCYFLSIAPLFKGGVEGSTEAYWVSDGLLPVPNLEGLPNLWFICVLFLCYYAHA